MILLILTIQGNQVTLTRKSYHGKASYQGCFRLKRKEQKGSRALALRENRLRYERNKEELILTESEEEEMGPDLEEFLWTYEDNLADYPAEVQKLANEALSLFKEKLKSIESETSKSKPKSG
ncbi:hypothetical protein QL285_013922 [Trifolium repens]|nr:hypothetical protein QL285_013922 [Trifolium repens]